MSTKNILTSIGVYRDGGSLSVSFKCDEVDTELLFEINHETNDDGEVLGPKFMHAYLKECHHFQWTNKVGATMDDVLNSTLPVSWATARTILRELTPQVSAFGPDDRDIFDQMVRVAQDEGTESPNP